MTEFPFKEGQFVKIKKGFGTTPSTLWGYIVGRQHVNPALGNNSEKLILVERRAPGSPLPTQRLVIDPPNVEPFDPFKLEGQDYKDFFLQMSPHAWIMFGGNMSGTDPEIFAFDSRGEVIPAWKWLKDKKSDPYTYWDGVQAEMDVVPAGCHEYLTDGVHDRLKGLFSRLLAYDKKAILRAQDVVELDDKTLQLEEDKYINLGCSPSLNAYEEIKPIEIINPREHKFRYSGTHLHFSNQGYLPTPPWWPNGVVALIDKIGGVFLTAMGRDVENPIRRQAYGRPGEYRLPECRKDIPGLVRMEYRTPGAFLLQHPAMFVLAADICRAAFRWGFYFDGRRDDLLSNDGYKSIITNCDADGAVAYIDAHKEIFDQVFKFGTPGRYSPETVGRTWTALKKGIKAFGIYDTAVADNWSLRETQEWKRQNHNADTSWRNFAYHHIK